MSTERDGLRLGRPVAVPPLHPLAAFVDAHRGGPDEVAAVLAEPFDGAPLTPEELTRRAVRRYPYAGGPRRALIVARALGLLATWKPAEPEPLPPAAATGRPAKPAAAMPDPGPRS